MKPPRIRTLSGPHSQPFRILHPPACRLTADKAHGIPEWEVKFFGELLERELRHLGAGNPLRCEGVLKVMKVGRPQEGYQLGDVELVGVLARDG